MLSGKFAKNNSQHGLPKGAKEISIRELYPTLSEEELKKAEENFRAYIALMLRMYERIKADAAAYAEFKALTVTERRSKLEPALSNKKVEKISQETRHE